MALAALQRSVSGHQWPVRQPQTYKCPNEIFVNCLVAAAWKIDYNPHSYPLPIEAEAFVTVVGYKVKVFLRGWVYREGMASLL